MQNQEWIDLFRTLPESHHNVLVITTLTGVDLSIETVLRTEETFIAFRGRVCGQIDDGRIFFLPYRQIDFLQINRTIPEAEFEQLYAGEQPAGENGVVDPGSGLPIVAPPKSGILIDPAPGSSPQVVPSIPQVPAAALRPTTSTRSGEGSKHGRKSNHGVSNIPAAALIPTGNAGPAPARNSILERLRAQRNAVLPPRPPTRQ
jgi:hypothetical protein